MIGKSGLKEDGGSMKRLQKKSLLLSVEAIYNKVVLILPFNAFQYIWQFLLYFLEENSFFFADVLFKAACQ